MQILSAQYPALVFRFVQTFPLLLGDRYTNVSTHKRILRYSCNINPLSNSQISSSELLSEVLRKLFHEFITHVRIHNVFSALSLSPSPSRGLKFGSNGVRKNEARAWCEELTEQVQLLQQQVSVLADNQTNTDDRYTRAKQDSAALQARVHMLEEQLREAELRAEERLQEEQRRHREMMARVDREKELHVENYSIRLQTLELEAGSLREETSRLRAQMERLRGEKASAEERLAEAEATAATLRAEALAVRDAERRSREEAAREQAASAQLVDELSRDLEQLRKEQGVSNPADSQHSAHLAELQSELSRLRQENKSLRETNEDLQAQILTRGVEEGRNLLGSGNSIAAELEAMSGEEMRTALKEQQEVNTQLRSYIDGMLLNIVENYPQLLEVKSN